MSLSPQLDLGEINSTLLIFGGPYSNLAATRAMLAQAERLSINAENIICTGDVVAYAAEPEQTSQLIKQSGIHLLMGNCEESLANDKNDCGCGFEEGMLCSTLSEGWYRYAQAQVSNDTRHWMQQLPRLIRFSISGFSCTVIHGGISQINRFIFSSTETAIKHQEIKQAASDILIGGHCGLPFGQKINNSLWLNAGVIGLPANDGTQDGWYLLMEPQSTGVKISWHRLHYDYQDCYQSMQQAGLNEYAETIKTGLWPSMDILPEQERELQGKRLNLIDMHYPSAG